ncbi:MAG: M23 family peptidase, partial [Bacteroidota bacterium]
MAREKFVYNTQTLRYEKVVEPLSKRLLRIAGFICAALVTAFLFTLISQKYFPSPKEKQLMEVIDQQSLKIATLGEQFDLMGSSLQSIQDRDATAHRMIFGMDPIDQDVWDGGVGGHDKYADLTDAGNSTRILKVTLDKVEKLKWKMALQSRSLDTILMEAQQKEEMLASIPSIKPVRSDKLARDIKLLSGFGMRLHPIHKVRKMHT